MVKLTNDAVQIIHSFLPDNAEHLLCERMRNMLAGACRVRPDGYNNMYENVFQGGCFGERYELGLKVQWNHALAHPTTWLSQWIDNTDREPSIPECQRYLAAYRASSFRILEKVMYVVMGRLQFAFEITNTLEVAHAVFTKIPGVIRDWAAGLLTDVGLELNPGVFDMCELVDECPRPPVFYQLPDLSEMQKMANFKYVQTNLHRYWTIPYKQAPRPQPVLRQMEIRNYFRPE